MGRVKQILSVSPDKPETRVKIWWIQPISISGDSAGISKARQKAMLKCKITTNTYRVPSCIVADVFDCC